MVNFRAVKKDEGRLSGEDSCEELTQSHLGERDRELPPCHS